MWWVVVGDARQVLASSRPCDPIIGRVSCRGAKGPARLLLLRRPAAPAWTAAPLGRGAARTQTEDRQKTDRRQQTEDKTRVRKVSKFKVRTTPRTFLSNMATDPCAGALFAVEPDGRLGDDRERFAAALRQHGFALLSLAGNSQARETIQRYKAEASAFFDAPAASKLAAAEHLRSNGVAGKFLPAGDVAARALASRREVFVLAVPEGDKHKQQARAAGEERLARLAGPPEPAPEPEAPALGFGDAAQAAGRLCQALAEGLLTELAVDMGVPPPLFRPVEPDRPTTEPGQAQHSLTAFHYLGGGAREPADDASVMLPTHYDMNLLTIQLPSTSPGLEVLDVAAVAGAGAMTNSAESGGGGDSTAAASRAHAHRGWISLESLELLPTQAVDLIVFCGAPLHRLTAGYYPACSHRVVAADGLSTRVSSVYKHKVADGAMLRTQAVIDTARAAGKVSLSNWTAQAAAVLRPTASAGHPFLLLEPLEEGEQLEDVELRQLEVAAALHNLAEMRPELLATDTAAAAAHVQQRERQDFSLQRMQGEKLGASVAADGTILGYTASDSAAARARLPKGWQIVAVDHSEVGCLKELKQRLGACSPGAAVVLTCAPRRAAAA